MNKLYKITFLAVVIDIISTYLIFIDKSHNLRESGVVQRWLMYTNVNLVWLWLPFILLCLYLLDKFAKKYNMVVEFNALMLVYFFSTIFAIIGNISHIIQLYQ